MKSYKINKSVSLKTAELLTKTRLISNKRNRMLLSLVSSGCYRNYSVERCSEVTKSNQ